jgi:hypothetical protein
MTIDPQPAIKEEVEQHPFNKAAALKFVQQSPLDNWLRAVVTCKIEDDETYDHPRILMMLLGEYLEISMRSSMGREDHEKICALCKMGFQMKQELFLKDEIMVCSPDCEYFEFGFGCSEE